jgi:hypothetical protein
MSATSHAYQIFLMDASLSFVRAEKFDETPGTAISQTNSTSKSRDYLQWITTPQKYGK